MSYELSEEEYQNFNPSARFEEPNPKMVQFIMDLGLAKNAKTANIILLSMVVIFFVVSIFFFVKVFKGPASSKTTEYNPLPENPAFLP